MVASGSSVSPKSGVEGNDQYHAVSESAGEVGWREAIRERDRPFAGYGERPGGEG